MAAYRNSIIQYNPFSISAPPLSYSLLFSPLFSSLLVSSYFILDMRFPSPHTLGFTTAASILSSNLPSMGNRP
jgi:hypothetical protein